MVEVDTTQMLLPEPNIVEHPHAVAFVPQQILDGNRPKRIRGHDKTPDPAAVGDAVPFHEGRVHHPCQVKKPARLRSDYFRDARGPRARTKHEDRAREKAGPHG